MKRTLFALLAVSIALSLICLHLVQQLREQQALVTGLQEQLDTQRVGIHPRPAPAAPFGQALTEMPRPTHPPESAQPAPVMPVMPEAEADLLAAAQMSDAAISQRELLQDPQYRAALRQRTLLTLPRTLPGVREALGLSEEQAAQLFELLADQQSAPGNPQSGRQPGQGMDEARLAAGRQRQAMDEQIQGAIREQFGEQVYQRWQDYRATLGTRHQVEQMRTSLARRGVVMEEDLVPVLVGVLANDQATWVAQQPALSRTPAEGVSEQRLQQRRMQQERSLQAIAPYLTSEQQRALQEDQREGLALLEGQLNIMRLQREAAQRAGTANEWAPADDRRAPP